jgi:molybdenum cofactor guanylyltransferase
MITGLILAGGRGERMGGVDKGLQTFRGLSLAQHAIQRLTPQVDALLINANHHLAQYAAFGVPVCTDSFGDFAGPLAGIEAGLRNCETPLMLAAPCDCPFLPENLGERLQAALIEEGADIAVAATGTQDAPQLHPVFCLVKTALLPPLSAYLKTGGRKVREWQAFQKMATVLFADASAFRNLNTLAELRELE